MAVMGKDDGDRHDVHVTAPDPTLGNTRAISTVPVPDKSVQTTITA
jgi:hypothetical protein